LMSYWILPESGIPISCTTVQRLTNLERQANEWKANMLTFERGLEGKFQATSSDVVASTNNIPGDKLLNLEREDPGFIEEFTRVIDNESIKHADEDVDDMAVGEVDPYVNMELGLPRGSDDELRLAHVKRRAVVFEGRPVGRPSTNPLLDSRQYEVEYLDGETEILTANIIAENLLAQVDDEGHQQMMIEEIEDHRVLDEAIPKSEGTYDTRSGSKRRRRTTVGWELSVRWKDGSSNWISLKDIKDTYPVDLADYAIANGIETEPAFAWWVPYVTKKHTAIIAKLRSKYWQRTHKYGIRVPRSVHHKRDGDTSGLRGV
jgi:hypothetical protein